MPHTSFQCPDTGIEVSADYNFGKLVFTPDFNSVEEYADHFDIPVEEIEADSVLDTIDWCKRYSMNFRTLSDANQHLKSLGVEVDSLFGED